LSEKGRLHLLDRERIITIGIVIGIFGGLIGGPVLSLADYYAPPEKRFWTFIIPEFIGFGCLILMVIRGKSKKKKYSQRESDYV
jgi:F0F1-type ATP synthase assembly protein I